MFGFVCVCVCSFFAVKYGTGAPSEVGWSVASGKWGMRQHLSLFWDGEIITRFFFPRQLGRVVSFLSSRDSLYQRPRMRMAPMRGYDGFYCYYNGAVKLLLP